ncbi:MAG: PIG-L family deacetylase [Chloroflexi bacterium]|nr:PIG-L family deacetylase [Chloroflexota bacterium]
MTDEELNRVLMVMAHPDDAEFSSAGTVAKWAEEGREVYYVICTNGDKGSSDPEMTPGRLAIIREQEQRAAAAVLGVKEVVFLGYGDGELEDTREFRGKIVRLIRKYKPDIVVTMNPYAHGNIFVQHRDHRMCGTATLDAIYPYSRDRLHFPEHIKEGLEPHKVKEVYLTGAGSEANVWVNIEETLDKKVDALLCHRSQIGNRTKEEFMEGWRNMAARMSPPPEGMRYAESFRRIELRR